MRKRPPVRLTQGAPSPACLAAASACHQQPAEGVRKRPPTRLTQGAPQPACLAAASACHQH
eukprot:9118398-Prorocentrum_lima.AAC.1